MGDQQFCMAFYLISEIGLALGLRDLAHRPGTWRHEFGDWSLELNPHREVVSAKHFDVPSFHALVTLRDMPVALVSPWGGTVLGGPGHEDSMIAALRSELNRIKLEHDGRVE